MSTLSPPSLALLYAAIVVATSFVAGLVPLFIKRPERFAHLLVGFAAGAVLGLALLHLIPDPHAAVDESLPLTVVLGLAALGAGVLYFIEHVLLPHEHHHLHQAAVHDAHTVGHAVEGEATTHVAPCDDPDHHVDLESSDLCQVCDISFYGVASFIGLSLHSLVDGLYLSLGAMAQWGPMLLVGIGLHKLAESFVLTCIFHLAHYPKKQTIAILIAFLAMTPLGAILGSSVLANTAISTAYLSAFAAGGFLYIAGHGLIPALWTQARQRVSSGLAVATGIATIVIAHNLSELEHIGHGH